MLELSRDTNKHVRAAVGENLYAPFAALEALTKDKSEDVRRAVARNKGTLPSALAIFATDKDADVRFHTTKNPSTSVKVLEQLMDDTTEFVCSAARTSRYPLN